MRSGPGLCLPKFSYQNPRSSQSLGDALEEYARAFATRARDLELEPETRAFFRRRDRCHVLFGCGASVQEEMMVDTWSLLGTTVPAREYLSSLQLHEIMIIYRDASLFPSLWESMWAVPALWQIAHFARQMIRKWPFHDNDPFLHVPLFRLRQDFNIQLVPARVSSVNRDVF